MPLQIPHPNTALHLYRHLLREATYLPGLCRPWIVSRIRQRYRDCQYRTPADTHIKQAHHDLRFMRSANAGHTKRLEYLCLMATGRVGKRRRILASTQLAHRPPADTTELEQPLAVDVVAASLPPSNPELSSSDPTNVGETPQQKRDWLNNWSLDMIMALAQSQVVQQTSDWPHTMRRTLDTKKIINGKNCFGRPYRPKLVRNKLKKHWRSVLRQLQVPLPQGEWDYLGSLVNGDSNAEELRIPSRRPVAKSVQIPTPNAVSETWDWTQHALKPARVIERANSRKMKSLTGAEDQDPRGHGRPIGLKVIGPSKLQRIYARVWAMSPVMREKEVRGKTTWEVQWGTIKQKLSTPSRRDLLFLKDIANDENVQPPTA